MRIGPKRCRPAPLRSAGSPARASPLSSPKSTTNPPRRTAARRRCSITQICAAPAITIKRKSHARSPDTRTIARARPSWLGEGVQGSRTKIRGARPRARGMARPAARIRNDAAPAETLRDARQSRPLAPFGLRRGCRLPQPARARSRPVPQTRRLRLDQWAPQLAYHRGGGPREELARLRPRPEGLPAGYIRPLLSCAEAVHRSRDRAWRRALRQTPAHDLSRKTAHPRRLGARNAQPRSGARSARNRRGPLRRRLSHDHQPDPGRPLARYDRHPDTRRCDPRPGDPQRLQDRPHRRKPAKATFGALKSTRY